MFYSYLSVKISLCVYIDIYTQRDIFTIYLFKNLFLLKLGSNIYIYIYIYITFLISIGKDF